MKKLFYYILVLGLLSSCVSTKRTTYFQGEPLKKTDIYKLNNEPYRLQVNDILHIDLKAENPELVALFKTSASVGSGSNTGGNLYFNGYTVDRHGNIRIPYIGDLNVLGYTEKEIRQKIEIELQKFLKNTESVFVTVKLGGINFIVTGEVGSPGTKNLLQNQVSIVDAIANSGEITSYGNKQNITIIRKTLDGVKKYNVNLTEIEVFESENFYIKPNDIIYVAPLKQKSWGIGTTGFQTFSTVVTVLSFLASTVLLVKNL
ncbi:polysaccharide biosynthesis/export family protein [Lutibacter aestuarii]|uniref:Polysaccharide biosynthesis/export family protein n=1 Tax=Lutibacter aestuarii TaxID=861111 RepID=A0ABW2Z5S2_9FLAO|nr:polysaccharide biosynthesis/export family protein [uncultured Lutibacter sp.]